MDVQLIQSNVNFILASTSPATSESEFVFGRMSGITRYLYENMVSFELAGYVTFALVFVLSAIVYKLGFAKKLPVGKNLIIYIFLFVGCIVLTFLALFLPMIEGLIVAALILVVYKTRLWREKNEEKKAVS